MRITQEIASQTEEGESYLKKDYETIWVQTPKDGGTSHKMN